MSYTIEYDRIFLRSTAGYTPLWLAGDSNCYEGSGKSQRRVRSWSIFQHLLGVSEEELLASIKPMLGGSFQEHWMRNSKWINDDGLVSWVKSGCRNAVTIEQLLEANRMRAFRCCLMDGYWSTAAEEYVQTTAELDAWISAAKKAMAENHKLYPKIVLNYGERVRHPSKDRGENELVAVKHKNRFVCARGDKSISTNSDRKQAMIFSLTDAQSILREFPDCRIVSASVLGSPCNMVVKITGDHGETNYLVGFPGPYKVRYTADIRSAKRYSTMAAAKKAAQTAKRRYPSWEYVAIELEI